MLILGHPSVPLHRVAYNMRTATGTPPHPRFVDDMFPELWAAALRHRVDPVVMVAQSLKETGAGHYGGKVPPTFFNTCGLKIRDPTLVSGLTGDPDAPLAHAQFAGWWAGAEAHAQHLVAYVQADLPAGVPLLDPRWVWVRKAGATLVVTVEALGGRWAPSATYGTEIADIAVRLAART